MIGGALLPPFRSVPPIWIYPKKPWMSVCPSSKASSCDSCSHSSRLENETVEKQISATNLTRICPACLTGAAPCWTRFAHPPQPSALLWCSESPALRTSPASWDVAARVDVFFLPQFTSETQHVKNLMKIDPVLVDSTGRPVTSQSLH